VIRITTFPKDVSSLKGLHSQVLLLVPQKNFP
jgi:hypothetical protein